MLRQSFIGTRLLPRWPLYWCRRRSLRACPLGIYALCACADMLTAFSVSGRSSTGTPGIATISAGAVLLAVIG